SKRPANPSPSTIQNLQLLQKTFWQKRHSIKTRQINGTETAHTDVAKSLIKNGRSGGIRTLYGVELCTTIRKLSCPLRALRSINLLSASSQEDWKFRAASPLGILNSRVAIKF
ncbi:hypothetical protein, partial [Brucella tritici]|uniref:hypothetical protein n=1 Tax=Brucella tritici TaxID=94626 RepID=UPI001AD7BEE7